MRSVKTLSPAVFFLLTWVLIQSGCGSSRPSTDPGSGLPASGTGEFPEIPASSLVPPVQAMTGETSGWVRETIGEMTLEEKVGQLVFVRGYGYYQNDDTPRMRRLFDLVRRRKIGGVCLFQGDVHTSAVLLNRLQQMSRVPLLVSADFEWGAAMRLRRSTRFPEAMAIGASRDTALAYRMGRQIGLEARSIGVHQVYAPVSDVNNNPGNPVINTRSFGEDPHLVSRLASAVARGIQSAGVLATAKHFPGHGDTDVDSHIGIPFMRHSRGRLDSVELMPFRSLVRDGVGSVMIAHCEVPSLGGPTGRPATLSPAAVDSLLVRDIGFGGLVVTDAMDMSGLTRNFGADSAAVLAIEAGSDVLLLPADEDVAIGALLEAVRSGRITADRLDRSVRKILAVKEWAGLADRRRTDPERISSLVAGADARRISKALARKSVTLLRNDNILPLGRTRGSILHVIVSDLEGYRTSINRPGIYWPNERVGEYYSSLVRGRWKSIRTVRIDPASTGPFLDSVARRASSADILLVSLFSKARSAYGSVGLPDSLLAGVRNILLSNSRNIVAAFGSPYVLASLPGASAYICAYSDAEASAEAMAEVLFGEIPSVGLLPVTIPALYPFGAGIRTDQLVLRQEGNDDASPDPDIFSGVDRLIGDAIADSAFPGAQLIVVEDNVLRLERSYGRFTYDPSSTQVTNGSLFDIASMTKVFATTAAMMRLHDEGRWKLDDRVSGILPRFTGGGRDSITLRQLLDHTSGLPPFRRYFISCSTPGQMLDSVYATGLVASPGDSTIYSDLGFILLGKVVESLSAATLDRYVDSVFFRPLMMANTMFRPVAVPDSALSPGPDSVPPPDPEDFVNPASDSAGSVVPTEYDSLYRRSLVRGMVHDENAYALGGVAGHAGLFSAARDLAVFMQMLLNGGSYAGNRYISWETVRLFTARRDDTGGRGLGWDFRSSEGYTSAGKYLSLKSFGHTGFTGTSVWADPEKKIFIIFLTNRVYPTRSNPKIRMIRPALHDAVMEALRGTESRFPR